MLHLRQLKAAPENPKERVCQHVSPPHTHTPPEVLVLFPISWENKDVYAAAIRSLRLRELQNPECVTAVRAGLGSIIPLQLLTMLTPLEMELRTCGLPFINLEFLKVGVLLLPAPHGLFPRAGW